MLKKLGIVSAIVASATVGVAGIAYAGDYNDHHHHSHHSHHKGDDYSVDCSSHEKVDQRNKGKQLLGGNVDLRNISGVWSGTADKIAICPSVGNNSDFSDFGW